MAKSWAWVLGLLLAAAPPGAAAGGIELHSASPFLDESFAWAKARALSLVRSGQRPDYIPCYFAAMSDNQFCVRDTAHMLTGAHLLGLDRENFAMVQAFCWGANRRTRQDFYWPRWHLPYAGRAGDDGGSCQWRTLPAPFDLAWRSYQQYLWSGDRQWVDDPDLLAYHQHLHTDFMTHQTWDGGEVAQELQQLASYFEFPDATEQLIAAGDSIGCQYQSLLAYAGVLAARGDAAGSQQWGERAAHLRARFETEWFDPATGHYIRGFDRFGGFRSDWGHENSYFMPLTLITDQGPRTAAYLDFIEASITQDPLNIEAQTYLPEVFYQHGRAETAWKYLATIMKSRHNYPEVAFTCVGNTVAGMLGVRPFAQLQRVVTLPQLPAEIAWAEADHVAVGGNDLRLRHDGNIASTLTNRAGLTITWKADFRGNFAQLAVDGQPRPADVGTYNGVTVSSVQVDLAPGQSATIKTIGLSRPDLPPPASPTLPDEAAPPAPAPGSHPLTELTWRYAATNGEPVQSLKSAPLHLGALTPAQGLAARGVSAIRYDLHRQYARLLCDAGFEDPAEARGAARFVVYGGQRAGRLLYDSGPLAGKARAAVRHVNLDVGDCDYIVLGVKDADRSGLPDRLVWGNPRLLAKGGASNAQPPPAPQGLRAGTLDHSSVTLSWQSAPGASGYDVYCDGLSVGSTAERSFKVEGLAPNHGYQFLVKAWDADGNVSAATETLALQTPLPPDLVYLSDLTWVSASAGYGHVQRDRSIDGHPLKLGGKVFERGLGTHAVSAIVYDLSSLGRGYQRFLATVGLDDEVGQAGAVAFQVIVDGQKRYDSGLLTPAKGPQTVEVPIAGAKELKLVVGDGGQGINSAHADWAEARLAN